MKTQHEMKHAFLQMVNILKFLRFGLKPPPLLFNEHWFCAYEKDFRYNLFMTRNWAQPRATDPLWNSMVDSDQDVLRCITSIISFAVFQIPLIWMFLT